LEELKVVTGCAGLWRCSGAAGSGRLLEGSSVREEFRLQLRGGVGQKF